MFLSRLPIRICTGDDAGSGCATPLLASPVTGKLSDSLYSNIRAIQRDRRELI
jgi:hypothetical protein